MLSASQSWPSKAAPHPTEAVTTTGTCVTWASRRIRPSSTPAWATAQFIFDDATRTLIYTINVFGVAPELVTAAHIHQIGAVGVNTDPKYLLLEKGMLNASGKVTIYASDVPALLAGDMYVN